MSDTYKAGDPCPTCQGSGVGRQDHGLGRVEYLGCFDCRGTGEIPEDAIEEGADDE